MTGAPQPPAGIPIVGSLGPGAALQSLALNTPVPNRRIIALRSGAPLLVGLVIAVAAQTLLRPVLGPYWSLILLSIGTNIILAVSLTMVNGFTGQFSLGHAGFLAVGGYASGVVTYYGSMFFYGDASARAGILSGMPLDTAGLSLLTGGDILFAFALLVGGLVSACLGYLVGLPSLRLRGDYLAIVTLGFGEIIRVLIQQTGPVLNHAAYKDAPFYKLPASVGGALGFNGLPTYTSLFWAFAGVALTVIVAFRLKRSTFGRAFLSVREDEVAAEAMGVDTTRYKVRAFVLSAFFAGIAGGLYGHTIGVGLSAESAGFQKSFEIIIMVVLGGLGSISGALLAAIIVTLLPEYLRAINEYRMVAFALALVLIMIFRPQGLLGVRELWDFLPRRKGPRP